MLTIRDPTDIHSIPDPAVRRLVQRRWSEVINGQPYDLETHGEMIVVQPGDTADSIERYSHLPIFSNPFDDARFPDPEFVPVCEALEEHAACYEMVFIFTDDGAGTSLFIPKRPDIDPELLALCATFSEPAPELTSV